MRIAGFIQKKIISLHDQYKWIRATDSVGIDKLLFVLNKSELPRSFHHSAEQLKIIHNLLGPELSAPQNEWIETEKHIILIHPFQEQLSLSEKLAGNPLNQYQAIEIAIKLLSTLNQIHSKTVTHNRLHPDNIFLLTDDQIQIKNFLWASIHQNEVVQLSALDLRSNMLAYISPEATGRANHSVDYRSDFYSFGVILYELLVNMTPFPSSDPMELIYSHLTRTPVAPHKINPDILPAASAIVMKLLAKKPEDRYQSHIGIRMDLQDCLSQLDNKTRSYSFTAGSQDMSSEFNIPEKLYGRTKELAQLLDILEAVDTERTSQTVSISAPPGMGKSTLIHELSNPVTRKRGYFIKGKFNQFSDTRPNSALIQAMNDLAELLSFNPAQRKAFTKRATQQLGTRINIISSLFPAFDKLLHNNDSLVKTGEVENRNRFLSTLTEFFSVLTDITSPIVIFIDDIQWADSASAELFDYLHEQTTQLPILWVFSYRTNEITNNKAMSEVLHKWKSSPRSPKEISISPIDSNDIQALINETITIENSHELSSHLMDRCNGNPLLLRQILNTYHINKRISYDPVESKWQWHIESNDPLKKKDYRTLIANTFHSLSNNSQNILKYIASMGISTSLEKLSIATGQSPSSLEMELKPACDAGIIYKSSQRYTLNHDRIQQTIIDLIPNSERIQIHYNIAVHLIENSETFTGNIYQLCEHLNAASSLDKSGDFPFYVAKFNLKAAEQAIQETAYEVAYRFALAAQGIMLNHPEKAPTKQQQQIHLTLARAEYLIGKTDAAYERAKVAYRDTRDSHQKIQFFQLLKNITLNQSKDTDLILELADKLLETKDKHLPPLRDISVALDEEEHRLQSLLSKKSISNILNQNTASNQELDAAMTVYADTWEVAYYAGLVELMQYCATRMTCLSIEHGNSTLSPFAYVIYGQILADRHQHKSAGEFGKLALKLVARNNDVIMLPKTNNLYCNYIGCFTEDIDTNTRLYRESLFYANENGDYLFGVWAALFSIWTLMFGRSTLDEASNAIDEILPFANKTRDTKIIYAINHIQLCIDKLTGNQEETTDTDEIKHLNYWKRENFLPGNSWHVIIKSTFLFAEKRYDDILNTIHKLSPKTSPGIVMWPISWYHFFAGVSALQSQNSIMPEDTIIGIIENSVKYFREAANINPGNFAYQHHILEALYSIRSGNNVQTLHWFERAQNSANHNGNNFAKAISREIYGDYLAKRSPGKANQLLLEAEELYSSWGASRVSNRIRINRLMYLNTTPGSGSKLTQENILIDKERLQLNAFTEYDFASIIRSTRAIAKQMSQPALLKTVLNIIMIEAGAERGIIILKDNDNYRVCAETKNTIVDTSINVALSEYHALPRSVIDISTSTKMICLSGNASNNPTLKQDPFIENNSIKSILCMPVVYKNDITAVLYLENNLTAQSFNETHISVLDILLGQMAISLSNTQLYNELTYEIEERRRTEEKLRISENRLRASHRYANIGTWEWNIITDELFWSEQTAIIFDFGRGDQNINVRTFQSRVHPEDTQKVDEAIRRCFNGEEYLVEHRILLPSGNVRWVIETGNIERNEQNDPIRMYGVVRDITQQKHNEQVENDLRLQLQQAQKMEAIGQLTGGIAHDFNNILTSIIGFSTLALEFYKDQMDESLQGYLTEISRAGNRGAATVKQMMAFSRKSESRRQTCDLREIMNEANAMLRASLPASVTIISKCLDANPIVEIDQTQILQVIMNLGINAKDAMNGTGELSISIDRRDNKQRCDACHDPISGSFISLTIKDSGSGIEPAEIAKIFEPFYTTKEVGKGSGMGLAMVHGIIHEHGGHIKINSTPGSGSEFILYFPVAHQQSTARTPGGANRIQAARSDSKILLVDDESSIGIFLQQFLSTQGYRTHFLTDGAQALEHIKEHGAAYDLIISDQTMPQVTGIELAREKTTIFPDLPLIICTGYNDILSDSAKNPPGVDLILSKPIDMEELLSAIQRLIPVTTAQI